VEQTQRAEVGVLWDTQSIWMMSRGVDDKECPNQGRHGLSFCQKKGRRSPKGTTKSYVTCWETTALITIYRMKKSTGMSDDRYRNGCPSVRWLEPR
jgi:hypothetical protein